MAYVHRGGAAGLYVVDTLGASPQILVPGDILGPVEPSWSPDGSRIAMRYRGDIWTVDLADGELHQWTDDAVHFPHWPAWSPDGRYILYSLITQGAFEPDTTWGLKVIDTADGTQRAILSGGRAILSGSRAAWSPNGRYIIISTPLTERVIYELFVVAPDGSGYRRLTALGGSAMNPAWTADGSQVFFDFIPGPCHMTESHRETWVVNSDGSGARRWSVNFGDPGVMLSYPFALAGTPDRCAAGGRDSLGGSGVIILMNLDGSHRVQLTR